MKTITIFTHDKRPVPITLTIEDAKFVVSEADYLKTLSSKKSKVIQLETKFSGKGNDIFTLDASGDFIITGSTDARRINLSCKKGVELLSQAIKISENNPGNHFEQIVLRASSLSVISMLNEMKKFQWRTISDGAIAWRSENGNVLCDLTQEQMTRYRYAVDFSSNVFLIPDYVINNNGTLELDVELDPLTSKRPTKFSNEVNVVGNDSLRWSDSFIKSNHEQVSKEKNVKELDGMLSF